MRRLLLALLAIVAVTVAMRGVLPCELLSVQPQCYVALHPGPVRDTLDLVRVGGQPVSASSGELLLTTVVVDEDLDLFTWFEGGLSPRINQVPRELVFPSGADEDEVDHVNAALMQGSQLDATVAALRHLGYEVDEQLDGAEVVEIAETTAVTDQQLSPGDVIVAVDGQAVGSAVEAVETLSSRQPGEEVTLTVLRAGDPSRRETPTIELIANPDDPSAPFVGILLMDHLRLPIDVQIDAGIIGGPSAGLMFALGIVDLLDPTDLTGGLVVAGTGTIDRDGRVGGIGSIAQKILGAVDPENGQRGATVFLVPADNFEEATAAPVDDEVLLVPVETLADGVAALADLRAGREPTGALALQAP